MGLNSEEGKYLFLDEQEGHCDYSKDNRREERVKHTVKWL